MTYDMMYVESGRKFAPRKRMRGCVVLDSDALARRAVAALDEQTVCRLRELFREPIQELLATGGA